MVVQAVPNGELTTSVEGQFSCVSMRFDLSACGRLCAAGCGRVEAVEKPENVYNLNSVSLHVKGFCPTPRRAPAPPAYLIHPHPTHFHKAVSLPGNLPNPRSSPTVIHLCPCSRTNCFPGDLTHLLLRSFSFSFPPLRGDASAATSCTAATSSFSFPAGAEWPLRCTTRRWSVGAPGG